MAVPILTPLDIPQSAAPANPSAGTRRLYVDSGTGKISVRTSAGASVSLEEQGGGSGDASFTALVKWGI